MNIQKNEKGIAHIVAIALLVVVVGVIALVGFRVKDSKNSSVSESTNSQQTQGSGQSTKQGSKSARISWQWNEKAWSASSTPPKCDNPVRFDQVPVDTSTVAGILYPGQVRGGNYKPHGGFKLNTTSNKAEVKAILDGYVASGTRYIEAGETQYMFTIVNNCGIAYRFDHLLELSPAFQKIANTLPEPKVNDSRTTPINDEVLVKKGDVIATAIGFKNTANYSFDLGIYDYRNQNEAAKSGRLKTTGLPDMSQSGYAVCWLDMFNGVSYFDYPAVDAISGNKSDYCK